MPALQYFFDLLCRSLDILWRTHLDIQRIDALHTREILLHGNRDDDGFGIQFGLPEAFDLLLESADNRELQVVDLDRLAERRVLAAIKPLREFFRQQCHLLPEIDIARVEKSSRKDYKIA